MGTVSEKTVGGHLALEFTNTLSWDPMEPAAGEMLGSFQGLLDWLLDRGLVSRKSHGLLANDAVRHPDEASAIYSRVIGLRAALHDIFSSYARGSLTPNSQSEASLNEALAAMPLKLRFSELAAEWDWTDLTQPGAVVWPVVWSAASLLTSRDLAAVKQCAGDRCGWLFMDASRRHNRKWCDMRDCGNRAKARRHYYRHRESS